MFVHKSGRNMGLYRGKNSKLLVRLLEREERFVSGYERKTKQKRLHRGKKHTPGASSGPHLKSIGGLLLQRVTLLTTLFGEPDMPLHWVRPAFRLQLGCINVASETPQTLEKQRTDTQAMSC